MAERGCHFRDAGVVTTDLGQLGDGPPVVLLPVRFQLVQAMGFRSLCGLPVTLEPGPRLPLRLGPALRPE